MSKYYAVARGKQIGIYRSWDEAKPLVNGFAGAKYKSFKTLKEAQEYIQQFSGGVSPLLEPPIQASPTIDRPPPAIHGDKIVAYTDGSCIDAVGGLGYVFMYNGNTIPFSAKVPIYPCTNQIAELYAIYAVIHFINLSYSTVKNISIYTDSKYSIGCLTLWYKNWQKNGWFNSKGEPVANKELIQAILAAMNGLKIDFVHVRGHQGDYYNEMADRLANQGRSQ